MNLDNPSTTINPYRTQKGPLKNVHFKDNLRSKVEGAPPPLQALIACMGMCLMTLNVSALVQFSIINNYNWVEEYEDRSAIQWVGV